jgi:hypothetical protein
MALQGLPQGLHPSDHNTNDQGLPPSDDHGDDNSHNVLHETESYGELSDVLSQSAASDGQDVNNSDNDNQFPHTESDGEGDINYFMNHSFASDPGPNPWSDNSQSTDSSIQSDPHDVPSDEDNEPVEYSYRYDAALMNDLNKWWVNNRPVSYMAYTELFKILR